MNAASPLRLPCALLLWLGLAFASAGQPMRGPILGPNPEFVDFDSPEAWAMKRFAGLVQPGSFGPGDPLSLGQLEGFFELSEVPFLDVEERRVGFGGSKVEDLNKAQLVVRPGLRVGLPAGFSLEASFIPPIEVYGLEATVFAARLAREVVSFRGLLLEAAAHYMYGEAEGSFTCAQSLIDGGHDPFDCAPPSMDRNLWRMAGAEATLSYPFWDGRLAPFASAAYSHLDSDFQVESVIFGGDAIDERTLKTSGEFWNFGLGLQYRPLDRLKVAIALRYAPLDVRREFRDLPEEDSLIQVRTQTTWRF